MRSSLLLLVFFLSIGWARYCVHNEKSWCQGHNIWGWCFHNKSSGVFNCDDNAFCVSQEQLKNKKSSGCFLRDNSSICCCNDADGCNLGFIGVQPKYAHGQQCTNSMEVPNEDIRQFRPCDDPFCYSVLTAEDDGGPTTVTRGCHSRKMVMHHMSKNEDDKYQNNTKWRETKQIAEMPSCAEILKDQPKVNGTTSMCVDFTYDQEAEDGEEVDEPIKMKGRLCCCAGSNKCNEHAMWADEGISLTEMLEEIEARKVPVDSSAPVNIILSIAFSIFLIHF
ncbi:Protein mtd-1 [Caenorhabditis elegans]|uniref:Protein mtd-1 n=1 Tax=Caenorhabditis elegans TaxID=6239 RepID=MTD1_CAEEL|nr:Protein mtd-1 [Caenorhabditis elegans]G5ECI1.1 RecName: Full=Protein mtd-1; AltName: Full=Mec three-dependent expression protein 1; Flags: Precursor [Caenorhabditis elegans]CAB51468.1 Protein mtd-1 [Caenorhabditis elegans]|eukprot:NP_493615.1 Mec-3 (Three) Dependent expression [Caenorhabditis elegans]